MCLSISNIIEMCLTIVPSIMPVKNIPCKKVTSVIRALAVASTELCAF